MYRILSKQWLFVGFAWLVIGIAVLSQTAFQLFGVGQIKQTAIPALAWFVLNGLLWNPIWRRLWKKFPVLNRLIFPDLNGRWAVELCSNWSRQVQLLDSAMSSEAQIDMRLCKEDELAELKPVHLIAEITQTWWSFEMKIHNPNGDTPIERSDTISVDPFARNGHHPPGICYFYKQVNATDNVSDDVEFYGAARLVYDFDMDRLTGLAWTARMWRRAMNTAGPVVFSRLP